MNEGGAREVLLVRAIETAGDSGAMWSDEDRAWATRAALEVAGTDAAPDAFVARRASLALERLRSRYPVLARALHAVTWRSWVAPALAFAAFALGVAADLALGVGGSFILRAPAAAVSATSAMNSAIAAYCDS